MANGNFLNPLLAKHNAMQLSPQVFSYRWNVGTEEIAQICCVSKSTVYHWLGGQASRRIAGCPHQRILAVADFLLANADAIAPLLDGWQPPEIPDLSN